MSDQEEQERYRYLQLKSKMGSQEKPTDWKNVIGSAVKGSFQRPARYLKDLGTNPESMAGAMPAVLGTAFGLSPVPGGATMGTAAGQGLRDIALKTMNKPVPGMMQHGLELGGAALGDVMAIPAMKRAHYGGEIGRLEGKAGVPPPQDIPSIPMATGQKSAGDFINDAVTSVKSSGGTGQPMYWKQIKDQVKRIYDLGADQKLTDLDKGRLKWLNQQVQEGLNRAVPGRSVPANALAKSQTIPNFIGRNVNKLPPRMRAGAQWGTGVLAPGIAIEEIIRRLVGK